MATAEAVADPPRLGPRGGSGVDRIAVAAFACLAFAAGGWIMYEGQGLIFFFDEWDWLLRRRDGLGGLFEPHNGHFSLVPVLVFKVLYATAGVEHYWAYRLVAVLAHVLCAGLLFALVRRRLGGALALAASTVLLALGGAWQVLLWPFEISYTFSIAAGLGALLALDAGSRRGDIAAAALVFVSLASSGLGIAVFAGVLAELALSPDRRRRLWVALAPVTLYAMWYLAVSPESEAKRGNADAIPGYAADAAAGAVGAVAGLGIEFGRVLLVLGAIVVVMRLLAPGPLPARLVGVLVAGLAYWGLIALARADLNEPLASRYVYFGVVIVLLIAAEATLRRALGSRAWLVIGLAVGVSVLSNLGDLRDGSKGLKGSTSGLRAALAATELAGDAVPAGSRPESNVAPQLTAGPYRELVADLGSPIGGAAGVLDDGPSTAVAVDIALARLLGITAVRGAGASAGDPPVVFGSVGGRTQAAGSCLRYVAAGPGAALDLTLTAGSSIVLRDATAPAELRLRRMAADFAPQPLGAVATGGAVIVAVPRDAIARPWVLRASPAGALRACTGAA